MTTPPLPLVPERKLRPPPLDRTDRKLLALTLADDAPAAPLPPPIAPPVDLAEQLSPATIQRRLREGCCARCAAPCPTAKTRRRSALCPGCWATHGWCSGCQRPRPRDRFHRATRGGRHGLSLECRDCRHRRRPLAPAQACTRCARPVPTGKHGRRKLCEACRVTHAWCSGCGARARKHFHRAIREGVKHSGVCLRCARVPRDQNGLLAYRESQAAKRAAAVADAQAEPTTPLFTIAARHGLSESTLTKALRAAGTPRGAMAKQVRAAARYAEIRNLGLLPAEIAARYGISHNAAQSLRKRALAALPSTGPRDLRPVAVREREALVRAAAEAAYAAGKAPNWAAIGRLIGRSDDAAKGIYYRLRRRLTTTTTHEVDHDRSS